MLGSLILYLKGGRTTMFQLPGFYYRAFGVAVFKESGVCVRDSGFAS